MGGNGSRGDTSSRGTAALTSPARLRAVRASGLLDTGPEEAFDRLAQLAAVLLGTPYAFVTVVDERRSFWKSCIGVAAEAVADRQNAVGESFCQYVIGSGRPFVVADARRDPRTLDNPALESMGVGAWLGYPVRDPHGEVLGTFCVVDTRPRTWTAVDERVVETLAHAASSEVALRLALQRVRADAEHAVHLQQQRYEMLVAQAPVGIFLADREGRNVYVNALLADLLGRSPAEIAGNGWGSCVHPDDRDQVARSWAALVAGGEGWSEDHRVLRPDGTARWVTATARTLRDASGAPTGFLGTCTDVTERRDAERARRTAEAGLAARHESEAAAARLHGLARATVQINDARTTRQALDVLARTARELIGAHRAVAGVTVDGDRARSITAVSEAEGGAPRRGRDTPRLAVPLVTGDGADLGLVQLFGRPTGGFTADDEAVLTQLAEISAAVLEKAQLLDRERQTNRRLELLQQATAALSAAATRESVAAAAEEQFGQLLGTSAVGMWELREDGTAEAIVLEGWGDDARRDWGSLPAGGGNPISDSAALARAVWLERPEDWEQHYPHLVDVARRYGVRSVACLPLLVAGRCLGMIGIAFRELRVLPAAERAAAQSLVEQCAQALHRAGLLAVESGARQAAEELRDVVGALSGATSPAEVADVVLDHARAIGAGRAVIVLRRHDQLQVLASSGRGPDADGEDALLPLDTDHPLARAVRTGEPLWDAEPLRFPADHVLPAQVAIPLEIGGAAIGAIGLHFGAAPPTISRDRRAVVLTIAGQFAQALDRARLHQAEHEVAETLQQSLLPPALPELERLGLAARYLPAAWGSQAGGDWYDVLPLGAGRVAIVVGDVVGQGPAAAAVMGQLRSALAAYLLEGHGPAAALERLDGFSRRIAGARASTAACLVLDTGTGRMRWARAGHPPPLVLGPDGARYLDGATGAVLGVTAAPPFTEAEALLAPGSSVLLYTDGLVERRGEIIDAGFDRLASAAAPHADAAPDALMRAVVEGTVDSEGRADDIAILVARLRPAPLERRCPARPGELGRIRRDVREWAAATGLSEDLADDLQLALGEAVTNSVEHAFGDHDDGHVTYRLEHTGGGHVRVSVEDDGRWRPVPADPGYRGRGLKLIHGLGSDATVETGRPGTLVRFSLPAAPQLRPAPPAVAPRPRPDPPAGHAELRVGRGADGRLELRLRGELDLTTARPLQAQLLERLRASDGPVTLDTRDVTYLSSAGVALLLEAALAAPDRLRLEVHPGSPTARILALTGLDQELPVR